LPEHINTKRRITY